MFSLPHKHCKHWSVGRSGDSQTKSNILEIRVCCCKFAGKQATSLYWPRTAVARPTILNTLFIALNSDNCEEMWQAVPENSSIKTSGRKECQEFNLCRGKKIHYPYFPCYFLFLAILVQSLPISATLVESFTSWLLFSCQGFSVLL